MKFTNLGALIIPSGRLSVVQNPVNLVVYAGPEEFIFSSLFEQSQKFRLQFQIQKVTNRVIYTFATMYRIEDEQANVPIMAQLLRLKGGVDIRLSQILETCADAIECNIVVLKNVVKVTDYYQVECEKEVSVESKCEWYVLKCQSKDLFDERVDKLFMLEKYYYIKDENEFSVHIYEIPNGMPLPGLSNNKPSKADNHTSAHTKKPTFLMPHAGTSSIN